MTARVSDADALAWKLMYERDGMSIEAIALEVGRAMPTVRKHLHRVGTTFRAAGSGKRQESPGNRMDGVRGGRVAGVHVVRSRRSFSGHRRRGF